MSAASACMESFMSMLANRLQVDQLSKNRIEITGIDVRSIQFILKRKYNVPGFQQKFFNLDGRATNWSRLVIHNFFVPELIYILHLVHDQIRSKIIKEHFDEAIEVITNNTWYKQISDFNESPADMNAVGSLMTKYPKDYQEEFVTQIYWQKKNQYRLNGYLLAMDVGTGKMERNTNLVRVPNGWKQIGNIQPGDKVIAIDGTQSTVLATFPHPNKQLYRVTFADGRYIDCGAEHLWTVYDGSYNSAYDHLDTDGNHVKTLSTLDILNLISRRHGRGTQLYIPFCQSEQNEDKSLPIHPYILGVLLGDGSLSQSNAMGLTTDIAIKERIEDLLQLERDTDIVHDRSKTFNVDYCKQYRIRGETRKHLAEELKKLGLLESHSWDKFIPEIYLNGSTEQRLELLRGLMDTDGYVTDPARTVGHTGKQSKCGCIEFSSSSERLADDVRTLVWSLGGRCHKSSRIPYFRDAQGNYKAGREAFRLRVQMRHPDEIFWLSRKRSRLTHEHQYSARWKLPIIAVTPLPIKEDCTCIAIDHPSQLYVTENYIVTHNTATSMFVKEAFHIKHAVVICPLSLVRNVWQVEIEDNYKKPVNAWYIGDNPNDITGDTEYVVTNYEAIDKIYATVTKKFKPSETIFIVDESHNFKDIKAQRTKWLTDLCFAMRGADILLLSGTPIKALQNECLPIFKLLDSFYDSEVEEQLKVLNRYPKIMNELLHNRLGLMMYRKTQDEVLTLPARHDLELKLSIRNGDKFTARSIQKLVRDYSDERRDFYMTNYAEYEKQFKDCLHYYESHYVGPHNQAVWMRYLGAVEMIHGAQIKSGLAISKPMRELIQWVNQFDEQEIIPKLPFDLRKQFRASRTVYKYVELKIMGEVIGDLLNQLRVEMTEQLIGKEVVDIINNAEKKTILFASYTDALKMAEKVCKEAGMKPLVITGENSKDAKELVKKFKETRNLNPLIASIKVMSTGHTINEANTVIFLNVPFRDVDYQQASGRCWRLGQDTEVWVYKLVLDTGDEPNLSTRMQDILTWSKEQFGAIVDGEDISDLDPDVQAISKFLSNPTEQIFEFAKSLKQRITRIL